MKKDRAALPTLEQSLEELTTLISRMEQGELPLEQSLAQFERGVTLVKHCQQLLERTEQKVQLLMQQQNSDELTDFNNPHKGLDDDTNHE